MQRTCNMGFLARTPARLLCYKCIQCPQPQGLVGLCSSRLTRSAVLRGGGCPAEADAGKLADKMLRTPKCSRCRNHGFLVPVKGHSGKCRWKQCTCEKCYLITERQKIMAAQKVLKKQGSDEEQDRALRAPVPELVSEAMAAAPGSSLCPPPPVAASGSLVLGSEGSGLGPERPPRGPSPGPSAFQPVAMGQGPSHVGPTEQAAAAVPAPVGAGPHLGAEAAGRSFSGRQELRRPLRPVPTLPFADFGLPMSINSDCMMASEYLERDPSKLYTSMRSYRPFPMGYQDASPGSGIPLQRGFRHVSYSHYHGSSLVSEPVGDFQPSYYPPPPPPPAPVQPQFLPPGFLSALHFLPPPPPPPPPSSFSLTIVSDTDKENTDDPDAEVPGEPNQPEASQLEPGELEPSKVEPEEPEPSKVEPEEPEPSQPSSQESD
ncbi:doublesex- and mab-3-related transcription factor B1 [Erinaceus europaeus]|uniref:Doublesex- and mab-3-related transcription factor B1 n=1 Tax=Erinaceus europaeus TaxID=9365 RepID=A0ABM3YJ12_ERIEU|nr:doublesex- and mab-3-related transcription factor B1 [Erinaceus europaeus]